MNWKCFLIQALHALLIGCISSVIGFEPMVIGCFAIILGYILTKDIGWLSQNKGPFVRIKNCAETSDESDEDKDYGTKFYVIDMGDCKNSVSRSRMRGKDGRLLTRRDLYKGDMDLAQFFYCQEFMCCSWDPPYGGVKGDRPSKEWWLDRPPYKFEVDQVLTKLVFGKNAYVSG